MTISTGRNDVQKVTLTFTTPSGVNFRCQEASIEGDGECDLHDHTSTVNPCDLDTSLPIEIFEDTIILRDIPKDAVKSVLVPHSDTSALHSVVGVKSYFSF